MFLPHLYFAMVILVASTAFATIDNGRRKLPEITETITSLILDTGGFEIFINYELWLRSRGEVGIQ